MWCCSALMCDMPQERELGPHRPRYHALDALRGLSLLLMILHHLAIDLVMFELVPQWLLDNVLVSFFQPIFASCFVALSGASSRFSRSNAKRGFKILVCAALVSAVTALTTKLLGHNVTVTFGILHFLGAASLIYWLLRPVLDKAKIHGGVWLIAFFVCGYFFPRPAQWPWLFFLGFSHPAMRSADYYPILPWIFMYLFGAWFADVVSQGKLPGWFYSIRVPFLEAVSRHSLAIYLVHQPVIMALLQLYFLVAG